MSPLRDEIESNSWSEYRREVLKSLNDLDQDIRELERRLDGNHNSLLKQMGIHRDELMRMIYQASNEITQLKTKASMWGGIFGALGGGAIAALVSVLIRAK